MKLLFSNFGTYWKSNMGSRYPIKLMSNFMIPHPRNQRHHQSYWRLILLEKIIDVNWWSRSFYPYWRARNVDLVLMIRLILTVNEWSYYYGDFVIRYGWWHLAIRVITSVLKKANVKTDGKLVKVIHLFEYTVIHK